MVVAADFDGDGDNDLAVIHSGTSNIYLFLNNGNGTFAVPPLAVPANTAYALAAADLDNDGDIDMVTSNRAMVLLNRGRASDGTWLGFAPGVQYLNWGLDWIVAADLSGDGLNDLALAWKSQHAAEILINIGHGTFQLAGSLSAGNSPCFITAGQLNGDISPDLAIASVGLDMVVVLLNESRGAASPDCNVNLLPDECDPPGDMDGDGDVDFYDVAGFIDGLLGTACDVLQDMNRDGLVNGADIAVLVDCLVSSACP